MTAVVTLALLLLVPVWTGGMLETFPGRLFTAIAGGAGLCLLWRRPRSQAEGVFPASPPPTRAGIIAVAVFLAYVAAQALNPSHRYVAESESLQPLSHVAWLPHSVDAFATAQALCVFGLVAVGFWLAATRLPRRFQTVLLALLVVHGFALALAGMLGGSNATAGHQAMGPFANANNFAAYLNLLTPAVLAFGLDVRAERRGHASHPAYLVFFAGACLCVAVAISQSRAGIAIGLAQLVAWTSWEWRAARGDGRPRMIVMLPILLAAALIALLAREALLQRAASLHGDKLAVALEIRGGAVRGTLAMLAAHPVLGIGAGAFARAFPYYQPPGLLGYFRFAHNDWLQTAAELGACGTLLLLAAVATALQPLWRHGRSACDDRLVRAIVLGLAGLAAHATINFPFQIPAIVLLAAALAGLARQRAAAAQAA